MKAILSTIFLTCLISLAVPAHAGRELSGTWKETARSGPGGSVAFTDTMRVSFLIGNEYTWSKPIGFIYRGTYKLTDKALDMGSRYYTIVSMTDDRMVLSDKLGQYTFVRDRDAGRMVSDQSAASHSDRAALAEGGYSGPPRSIDALMGKWEVYKRTASEVQKEIDYSRQLRVIELKKNKGGEQGLVFAANDMQNKPSWYMDRYENGTIYCKGRDARQLKVLHLADGELVIGEGDITYFFKQFKQ